MADARLTGRSATHTQAHTFEPRLGQIIEAWRNKQLHDLLYTNKFAPRSRAAKVELPGRIGKNPFNKDNGDALSPDLAGGGMAPAAADPMMGGTGGMGGPGRRGANLADEWDG